MIDDENIMIKNGYGSSILKLIRLTHLIINDQMFQEAVLLLTGCMLRFLREGLKLTAADRFFGLMD